MENSGHVEKSRRSVLENRGTDKRIGSEILLVYNEGHQPGSAHKQRNKCPPRIPGVLDSTPCYRNEEASRRREEQHHADPVDFAQFGEESTVLLVELEEDSDEDSAESEER